MSFITTTQGQIQDFIIGGSNLQRGFDLLILTVYLFLLKMKSFCLKGGGEFEKTPSGSAFANIEKGTYHSMQSLITKSIGKRERNISLLISLTFGAGAQKNHLNLLKPIKVSKGAKIRNRYNQVPHLTQDTNGKVTNSQ